MTVVRPTQVALEVLVVPNPHLRPSQVAVEVVVYTPQPSPPFIPQVVIT